MIDDILSLKATTSGRCGSHSGEKYARAPNTLAADLPPRDAAFLISLRGCKAKPSTGQNLIHGERLDATQSIDDRARAPCGHETPRLLQLDAKRPEFGLPRWSVGAIKLSMHFGSCIEDRWY